MNIISYFFRLFFYFSSDKLNNCKINVCMKNSLSTKFNWAWKYSFFTVLNISLWKCWIWPIFILSEILQYFSPQHKKHILQYNLLGKKSQILTVQWLLKRAHNYFFHKLIKLISKLTIEYRTKTLATNR